MADAASYLSPKPNRILSTQGRPQSFFPSLTRACVTK